MRRAGRAAALPEAAPQPLRYIAVGVLNTLVAYGIFALCVFALRRLAPHGVILAVAHVLAVSFGFFTHGRLVFSAGWPQTLRALAAAWGRSQLSYLGIGVLGLAINGVLIGGLGWSIWWAQAAATLVAIGAGWLLNRHVIFAARAARTPGHGGG